MQKLTALLLFALAAISIGVLVSGASYSEWVLPGGLPLGNALAAIGLCSLAGSAYNLSPVGSVRRRISQTVLVVTVLWLPISIALAGNLELNFSGSRGTAWLVISSATAIAVLSSLALAIAGALLSFAPVRRLARPLGAIEGVNRLKQILKHSLAALWPIILIVTFHGVSSAAFGHQRWLDPPLHFLGGMALLYVFSYCLRLQDVVPYKIGLALVPVLAVVLLWELGEFLSDRYLHTHVQRGIADTISDIVLGLGGALAAACVLRMKRKDVRDLIA